MLGLMRILVVVAAVVIVVGGYVASQWAYFRGDPTAYAKSVDSTPMAALSWLLLLGAIGLAIAGRRENGS